MLHLRSAKEEFSMKHAVSIPVAEPNRGVLDFSYLLDAPAGKHGFVRSSRGHLFFEDGTRARFLGFNIAARSNTPDHADAERLAERFASMGVNVIRLHAADAPAAPEQEDRPGSWSSSRRTPLLDFREGSRQFNPEGLDRFDYLISKLKERGIYLHIDLIVARPFLEGDGLDYPGNIPSCMKRYPMYNARLIELQKEYAKELLCHVNPYTGLALKDDPAVITVQINNEESAIKGNTGSDLTPEMEPYRREVSERFGDFLLMKYHTRERLKEAWTLDGVCALGDDEDPARETVRGIEGGFYQSVNDPCGAWDAAEGPARYADFMEFGAWVNRSFYREMKDYLVSLGVRVPINASNLVTGAADVYGHAVCDIMENNTYFNHPLLPVRDGNYMVYGPTEYVSVNPLTVQRGVGSMGTTLVSLASVGIVGDRPFMLSEWNEYGLHPFHSTAFVHTVAYACLNDWDGLILYNYHTSEDLSALPADEVITVFDAYNDPALISQWGFMASVFLKGMISPAKNRVDVVYTQNDWKTLPNFHAMPMCFLPYVTAMRNVFLEEDDLYRGDADVAVNAGFLNGGDLRDARHSIWYAWSPYREAERRARDDARLPLAAAGAEKIAPGVYLGEKALVFDNIRKTAKEGDYREFAAFADRAMKQWGVMDRNCGYTDGKLISDTGEICFDPDHARFFVRSASAGYFSGAPEKETELSNRIRIAASNARISLALMPLDAETLDGAENLLLTALGETGTDRQSFAPGPELMPGLSFTAVRLDGKLFAETLEGCIYVKAESAELTALDMTGREIGRIEGERLDGGVVFRLDGSVPALHFRMTVRK